MIANPAERLTEDNAWRFQKVHRQASLRICNPQ